MEVSADELRAAVEQAHNCTAQLAGRRHVSESFEGKPVWDGFVHVFELTGHPAAFRAYAWSSPIDGSSKRRFFAVLHMGAIKSPIDAVRAAIAAEQRQDRGMS
jgi:hypothetical protein